MNKLENKIRALIKQQGPIPLNTFMHMALQDPEDGYYIKQDPLGQSGDFITAPEISQIFGEMIGLWVADFMLRNPVSAFHLVELGPGRGTLMSDMVRVIKSSPALAGLADILHIHLVETSPALRLAQKSNLDQFSLTPQWHEDFSSLPQAPCLVIANEFFDALPIQQFIHREGSWQERLVALEGEDLVFTSSSTKASVTFSAPAMNGVSDGDIIEVSPASEQAMTHLCRHINAFGGGLLAIDYGYVQPALGDSFQALHKHNHVSPLTHIGDADLTAHVNFSALADIARISGLRVWGPETQGHFLTHLGAETRLHQILAKAPRTSQGQIADAYQRLIAPDQMGHLFKVLAVTPAGSAAPEGFPRA
ncbi:MAG: class I SAM-dependent methyltransferase [Parvibaculales bacterium]